MSKELTEKWKNGTLETNWYYCLLDTSECIGEPKEQKEIMYYEDGFDYNEDLIIEIFSAVPSYESLYNPNDGRSNTTGLFTILKIIKRDIENAQKQRSLTDLECGIKSQVVSLLKKWGVK